jgi:hypothetical protein
MLKLSVRVNLSPIERRLRPLPGQIRAATAQALNAVAQDVADAQRAEMQRIFRSPVPYTLGSIYVRNAYANFLQSSVGIKNSSGGRISAIKWLTTEIQGGQRNVKAMERAFSDAGILPSGWTVVPGPGAKLDGNGNVSISQIRAVLSQTPAPGSGSSVLQRRRGKLTASPYFAVLPGSDETNSRLPYGLYMRKGGKQLTAIFLFLPRRPGYSARYDFYGVAERTARAQWPIRFHEAMARIVGTSQ